MKRDMELIREILIHSEAGKGGCPLNQNSSGKYTEEHVGYHCYLIGDAGLATVLDVRVRGDEYPQALISSLNWAGHEFLDASRDPTTWEKAKQTLSDAGRDLSSITMATLQSLLIELTKKSLGL